MQRDVNKRGLLLILMLSLFLAAFELPSEAFVAGTPQERNVGVRVGDWAEYGDISVTWTSTNPNAQPDQNLINANATAWFNITVLEVTATIITFQNTTGLKNDTVFTNTDFVDVELGTGKSLTFIAAGLNTGEPLYFSEEGVLLVINETVTRGYADVTREVNHLNLAYSNPVQGDPLMNVYIFFDYYWDKTTGILTERQGSFTNQTEDYITSWSRSDRIVKTNIWSPSDETSSAAPPTDNTPWLIGGVAVVAITIVFLWKRRKETRLKRSRRKFQSPRQAI